MAPTPHSGIQNKPKVANYIETGCIKNLWGTDRMRFQRPKFTLAASAKAPRPDFESALEASQSGVIVKSQGPREVRDAASPTMISVLAGARGHGLRLQFNLVPEVLKQCGF